MDHLSPETLSEYLDGGVAPGAEEHLAGCPLCEAELEALRELREELRSLPELDPPPTLWAGIEARLPVGRRARWPGAWPGRVAIQAVAAAAVFVLGLGLGRMAFDGEPTGGDVAGVSSEPQGVVVQPAATTLAGAMDEVRLRREQYDNALRRVESFARQSGAPLRPVAEARLAALDVLVEATQAALSAEPADPVLNSYLFAAMEQRAEVLREIGANSPSRDSDVLWR